VSPDARRLYLIDDVRAHAWSLTQEDRRVRADRLAWGGDGNPPEGISSLALSPDGTLLALGDRNGLVRLFDTSSLSEVGRIDAPESEARSLILALAFSPDGQDLAVGSQQGAIFVWSLDRGKSGRVDAGLRLRLPGHTGLVMNLTYDAQGDRLASAGTGALVEVWNLAQLHTELDRLGLGD
jgi:WD40 repeat protein